MTLVDALIHALPYLEKTLGKDALRIIRQYIIDAKNLKLDARISFYE